MLTAQRDPHSSTGFPSQLSSSHCLKVLEDAFSTKNTELQRGYFSLEFLLEQKLTL